jgi:hypothetical protein
MNEVSNSSRISANLQTQYGKCPIRLNNLPTFRSFFKLLFIIKPYKEDTKHWASDIPVLVMVFKVESVPRKHIQDLITGTRLENHRTHGKVKLCK